MKKILVVAIALIATVSCFGQISISSQKMVGVVRNGSQEDASITASDKTITIKYMGTTVDNKWSSDVIRFNGTESDLNTLYDAFISVLDNDDKKYSIDITLGENSTISVKKTKVMGVSYVSFGNGLTNTRPLNKNQINKLFGK